MSDQNIVELHAAYCQASGFDLPLRMGRDRVWFDFDKAGFTKEDLLLVIRWTKQQIGRRAGFSELSLRFSTLLQLDYFEEKLMIARKELRPRRPATVPAVQRVGDITRLIEKPAPDGIVTSRSAAAEALFAFGRKLRAGGSNSVENFPLPSTGTQNKTDGAA